MDEMELTYFYRVVHPIPADCIVFSAFHRTFSKVDHILGHKANLNKYNNIKIILYILTDHGE
jgi:hypothetical protein